MIVCNGFGALFQVSGPRVIAKARPGSHDIFAGGGGQITGERKPAETNEQDLGLLMAGVTDEAA